MVSILQMDINDVESVQQVIYHTDMAIQYGENLEPNDRIYNEQDAWLYILFVCVLSDWTATKNIWV